MQIALSIRITLSIITQRLRENFYITEATLLLLMIIGMGCRLLLRKKTAFKVLTQVHRTTRLNWLRRLVEPTIVSNISLSQIQSTSEVAKNIEPFLGNRIMVLKCPRKNGEKGVLLVMYSELFKVIPQVFKIERLLVDYRLILETSWAGNCDEDILYFTKYHETIFVFSPEKDDYNFLVRLGSNLKPLPIGSRDWVDPALFDKHGVQKTEKEYDIIMNANWGWGKRHHILFKSLRKLDQGIKVALIGFPWGGRRKEDIINLARYYNVEPQIDFFEERPYEDVINITSRSKIGILLSLKEGSNRAIPECLFCDVPVIVLHSNIGGVREVINPQTGIEVKEKDLTLAIEKMLNNYKLFKPRHWAMENISCVVTGKKLNNFLKKHALSLGEHWTKDIVVKTNSPELKYYDEDDKNRLWKYNLDLKKYFKQN